MEKIVPNQFNNRLMDLLTLSKIQILFMKRLLLLLVLACYCAGANAQEVRTSASSQIIEVNAYLAYVRASESTSRNLNANSARLEKLLKEIQPAIYYRNGMLNSYGENPTSLYTDANSLRDLETAISAKAGIEIVTINLNQISDLNTPIDLTVFSSFPALKYIYILSTVETSGAAISQSVRNNNNNYGVFYKVDKGS